MFVTVTINLWWLVWLLALVYVVVSVLGVVSPLKGMVVSEIRLYRSYGKQYTLARYLTWACGRSWRWVFLPAHLLTYALGWLTVRRSTVTEASESAGGDDE